jgi:fatty acid desaturase
MRTRRSRVVAAAPDERTPIPWEHAMHHGTAGDLDRRGTGDVWTMIVQQYLEASRWRRFSYRLARNPMVLFVLALLFVSPRIPNYNLQRCHESERLFQQVKPITLGWSLSCLTLRFWDEQSGRLVGYAHMRELRNERERRRNLASC